MKGKKKGLTYMTQKPVKEKDSLINRILKRLWLRPLPDIPRCPPEHARQHGQVMRQPREKGNALCLCKYDDEIHNLRKVKDREECTQPAEPLSIEGNGKRIVLTGKKSARMMPGQCMFS